MSRVNANDDEAISKGHAVVDLAIPDMGAQSKTVWERVDRTKDDLPAEAAEVALTALSHFERFVRDRLATKRLSEHETSELSNGLSFICAIERD